jgi:shikimate dehydrogenase
MELYGLIGKEINHSFSPDFFKKKFAQLKIDAEYRLFPLENIDQLPQLLATNPKLRGLNVTIPYKRMVSPYLHEVESSALYSGSVNTIKIEQNSKSTRLIGHNTDIVGFEKSLLPFIKGRKNLKALVLGNGGTSRAIAYVLRKLGIIFLYVSRTPQKVSQIGYNWVTPEVISEYKLIINTTPLGMFPNVDAQPEILYSAITPDHLVYDVVYNPIETNFLRLAREQGARTKGGLEMLELQAEASWKIWKK